MAKTRNTLGETHAFTKKRHKAAVRRAIVKASKRKNRK